MTLIYWNDKINLIQNVSRETYVFLNNVQGLAFKVLFETVLICINIGRGVKFLEIIISGINLKGAWQPLDFYSFLYSTISS